MSMKGQATGTIRVYSSCVTAPRYSYLYPQHLRCCAGSFQNVLADASTLGYDSYSAMYVLCRRGSLRLGL
jgi:hypothetical protein